MGFVLILQEKFYVGVLEHGFPGIVTVCAARAHPEPASAGKTPVTGTYLPGENP